MPTEAVGRALASWSFPPGQFFPTHWTCALGLQGPPDLLLDVCEGPRGGRGRKLFIIAYLFSEISAWSVACDADGEEEDENTVVQKGGKRGHTINFTAHSTVLRRLKSELCHIERGVFVKRVVPHSKGERELGVGDRWPGSPTEEPTGALSSDVIAKQSNE